MSKMTNIDLSASALSRARRWLKGALRALEDGRWGDVVYCSQMAVEHASKAVLIAFGIDYPREHDVSMAFKKLSEIDGIPRWFTAMVDELAENISTLAQLRGLAGYGYEEGVDADYFKDYAPEAYERAEKHYNACLRLLTELYKLKIN